MNLNVTKIKEFDLINITARLPWCSLHLGWNDHVVVDEKTCIKLVEGRKNASAILETAPDADYAKKLQLYLAVKVI